MKNKMKYVILGLGMLLTVLITVSFLALQLLLRDSDVVVSEQKEEHSIKENVQTVVFIERIDDDALRGLNLEQNKALTKELKGMQARDKSGNKMPLSQLKAGQIVVIENEVITPSPEVHTINDLTGVKINLEKMIAQVGNTSHHLADELLAVDAEGQHISLTDLSPYDVVSLNIYKDEVWSIIREEASASLTLTNVPKDNGQISIDNSRLIQLKDAKNSIPITAGEHKIVLKIVGYVPRSIHIFVESGENYILSLSDIEMAYTTLKPQLNVSDYTITISDVTYGPNDTIELPHGQHIVTIQSDGYKTWQGRLDCNKDIYLLRVNMIPLNTSNTDGLEDDIDLPSTENTDDFLADMSSSDSSSNTSTNGSSNSSNISTNGSSSSSNTSINGSSSSSNSGTLDIAPSTAPNAERTITISTSPASASIYQGNTLIGTSPYTLQLKDGSHEFTIRKEGYSPYTAKITLDNTDEGGIYLYKLKPTEEAAEEAPIH